MEKIFPTSFFINFSTIIKNFEDNSEVLHIILLISIKIVKIRIEKKSFPLLYNDCFFILFILYLNYK